MNQLRFASYWASSARAPFSNHDSPAKRCAVRAISAGLPVNGAAHSQHCYGMAADISVSGQKPETVAAFARTLMPDWGGVGVYDSFCHIDVREAKADWKG